MKEEGPPAVGTAPVGAEGLPCMPTCRGEMRSEPCDGRESSSKEAYEGGMRETNGLQCIL